MRAWFRQGLSQLTGARRVAPSKVSLLGWSAARLTAKVEGHIPLKPLFTRLVRDLSGGVEPPECAVTHATAVKDFAYLDHFTSDLYLEAPFQEAASSGFEVKDLPYFFLFCSHRLVRILLRSTRKVIPAASQPEGAEHSSTVLTSP
jgi:hypothetical protein